MIVDDHTAFRAMVGTLLRAADAVLLECESGRQAVDQYPTFQPDVVLMDVAMKDMDGLTATAELTARFPTARVVILTQYDDPDLRAAAERAGACDYVLKDGLPRWRESLRAWSARSGRTDPRGSDL